MGAQLTNRLGIKATECRTARNERARWSAHCRLLTSTLCRKDQAFGPLRLRLEARLARGLAAALGALGLAVLEALEALGPGARASRSGRRLSWLLKGAMGALGAGRAFNCWSTKAFNSSKVAGAVASMAAAISRYVVRMSNPEKKLSVFAGGGEMSGFSPDSRLSS